MWVEVRLPCGKQSKKEGDGDSLPGAFFQQVIHTAGRMERKHFERVLGEGKGGRDPRNPPQPRIEGQI